ncbi:Uncharacterised protein [Zhongshania aliphaticivorans]|uniref:DUF2141 domain-containing protein n=1 Tax=Zhongshania aliphaticivorans TaxID=1470434 RepID=A0A5S9MVE6_9GAMM|nr:DUF2141 domain-containing protein [Zhongshania aliphaticivorans]CAA0081242.1 Uncharacterised protein [Zhongshania aliphaticivorans]CAA0085031.1 Uncharacterised protein [Zhongshania aliphaticivorans]
MITRAITLLALNLFFASPSEADSVNLNVLVDGIKQETGTIVVRVYNKDNWLSDAPLQTASLALPADYSGSAVTIPMDIALGNYAFTAYHDLDDNGQMNKTVIGLPAEPVGLSNDHKPRFGPPRYRKAEITIGSDTSEIRISLD